MSNLWWWGVGAAGLAALGWAGAPALVDLVERGRRLTRATVDGQGVVQESPDALARTAGELLGRGVDVDAYALARMVRSEAGSGAVTERTAVAWIARNDARARGWPLLRTLTYHKTPSRDGRFGSQLSGRYATTRDPYEGDLKLAEAVLAGQLGDPTDGATKFVHRSAFGVQPGTRTYAEVAAEWAREGYRPITIAGAGSDFVAFRRSA